jgi:hypothetical protein
MPNWKKVITSGSNAILNNITASGGLSAVSNGFIVSATSSTELEVQGTITASGHLFASLSFDSTPVTDGVVVYDTADGRFYLTGSYGAGGGSVVTANPGTSEQGSISTIAINGENFSIGGDDDWFINGVQGTVGSYLQSSRIVAIGAVPSELPSTVAFGLSVGVEHAPAVTGVSLLGRGLQGTITSETVTGLYNKKDDQTEKLFTIGNGVSDEVRRNIALFRSKSIDFSPDGRILSDYYPASLGGNMAGTTFDSQEIVVEFDFTAHQSNTAQTLNTTISDDTNTNGTLFNNDVLQTAIDNALAVTGNNNIDIELTRIDFTGDVDGGGGELLTSVTVGNEEFIADFNVAAAFTSNNVGEDMRGSFLTIWSSSLTPYGGTDNPPDLSGVDDGATFGTANGDEYQFGSGVHTSVQASANGVNFQCSFGSGVTNISSDSFTSTLSGNTVGANPGFRFTFKVPVIKSVLPTGVGLFVGRELDRDGGENNLSTVLGNKNHAVTITHVAEEDAGANETSGLRIIVGDANDNTGVGGEAGGVTTSNSFITFDFKNADETHGFERMGFIGTSPAAGQPMSLQSVSDKRLKENIKLTKKGLSIIKEIKVRDFNWKKHPNSETTGFIAQELYKVIPEAVLKGGSNPKMNPWTLNYQALIPYMVKAIQEQQKLIENLQKQIDQLK